MASSRSAPGAEGQEVIIVGGGVSGLTAAYLLTRLGVSVTVLEAAPVHGGRVQSIELGEPWGTLQLGAQVIHGNNCLLASVVDELGWHRTPAFITSQGDGGPSDEAVHGGVGLYYFKQKDQPRGRWLRYDSADAEFRRVNAALGALKALPHSDAACAMTVGDYLRGAGVSAEMLAMADASFANTSACTLDAVSAGEMAVLERWWDAEGEPDSVLEGGFGRLTAWLAAALGAGRVRCGARVRAVDARDAGAVAVEVEEAGGRRSVLRAAAVIVATPLSVMQAGDIEFRPALPDAARAALGRLGWQPVGMKLMLMFRRPLWEGAVLDGVICTGDDCPVPELMISTCAGGGCVIAAFAMGDYARGLLARGKEGATEVMLAQLEHMFGAAARREYVFGVLQDWSAEPFVRGGYSFPALPGAAAARAALTSPGALGDARLGLCGEYACAQHQMTVHAALESGERAAMQCVERLRAGAVARAGLAYARAGDVLLPMIASDARTLRDREQRAAAAAAAAPPPQPALVMENLSASAAPTHAGVRVGAGTSTTMPSRM